jgi:hypothetical protein
MHFPEQGQIRDFGFFAGTHAATFQIVSLPILAARLMFINRRLDLIQAIFPGRSGRNEFARPRWRLLIGSSPARVTSLHVCRPSTHDRGADAMPLQQQVRYRATEPRPRAQHFRLHDLLRGLDDFAIIGIEIKQELGLNDTQFGLLVGTPILTGSLVRLFLGVWTDQYGGRIVFPLTMLASAASTLLLSHADTYLLMLLAAPWGWAWPAADLRSAWPMSPSGIRRNGRARRSASSAWAMSARR